MGQNDIKGSWTVIVYSNSDSYGVVSDGQVYAEFIAEQLNATLINQGKSGSCNDRILRTTTRDILALKNQIENKEKILVLISLASIWRSETWVDSAPVASTDGHFVSFQIGSLDDKHNNFSLQIKNFAKEWFLQTNYEAIVTDLYFKLTLMISFLQSNNIDYLIWSGPKHIFKPIDLQAPFIKDFSQNLSSKNLLSLFDFNFCDWCLKRNFIPIDQDQYGIYGHHGESAHRAFAEFLLENYLGDYNDR